MVILLVNFLLVLSCFSAPSTSALVPETFRPACCSYTPNTLVSTTRFLRESGVPAEIETAVDALLETIARTYVESQTKRRKVSHGATSEHEHSLHSRRQKMAKVLFGHEAIQRWIKHVNELKVKNPESEISVIPRLVDLFGDEELFKILELAVRDQAYANLATELQAEQMHSWMKRNIAPDKVFDILGLGKTGTIMLDNPNFLYYVTYFDRFRAKNPDQPTCMATTILKHQSAADLIRQINDEKTSKSKKVQKVAKELENDLIAHLVQTQPLGEALDSLLIDFSAHLRLSRDTLKSICIELLVGYIKSTDTNLALITNPADTKVAVISELVKRFSEKLVVYSIITTNADDAMGVELRPVLLEYWLSKGKSIDDVMNLLRGLGYWEKSDSLRTQSFNVWFPYMLYVVERKPDEIKSLLTNLGAELKPEDLSRFFLRLETYSRLSQAMEKSPETMFQALKLADKGDAMIEDTTFLTWLAYRASYERRHPDSKISLATIFNFGFTDGGVQQLLKKLKEMLNDKQTRLARSGLLRLNDVS
ncbi:hypothetical protein PsorP6_010309 [Peronosclerospora sorghi]|uniref:Uncharacterized protein n=1 Tax=Peronosclerospora sorghi TaxID=230839 RepID=A0ACC0VXU9_9STRA|nr:hypothetical protein PsorP6_010309 [Peronosclerospora sorghi]